MVKDMVKELEEQIDLSFKEVIMLNVIQNYVCDKIWKDYTIAKHFGITLTERMDEDGKWGLVSYNEFIKELFAVRFPHKKEDMIKYFIEIRDYKMSSLILIREIAAIALLRAAEIPGIPGPTNLHDVYHGLEEAIRQKEANHLTCTLFDAKYRIKYQEKGEGHDEI